MADNPNLTVFRTWKSISLIVLAGVLLNWLVGGVGFLTYQWFQSSAIQVGDASAGELNDSGEGGRYWAEKIASGEGAFVLYFRHAEREKWPLVATYDYFEVVNSVDGSEYSFAGAVCLSEKGKEDASLVGQALDTAGVPVTRVLSSPSCRARQTASLAFGRIDVIDRAIMSAEAVGISRDPESYASELRNLLMQNIPGDGERVVVAGHAQTLEVHASTLFPEFARKIPKVNESGFYVIEVVDGRMVPRWAFVDFYDFSREILVY